MNSIADVITAPEIKETFSTNDFQSMQVMWYNSTPGKLQGYDCSKCLNRGNLMVIRDGYEVIQECECMQIRRSYQAAETSGLKHLIKNCTFEAFQTDEQWQVSMKRLAAEYCKDSQEDWMLFSGNTGCGKTHICTAVSSYLLRHGRVVKYKLWSDILHEMSSAKFRIDEYNAIMDELRSIDVLYIDDFLKTPISPNGQFETPEAAEIRTAYEVINARYNANKKTIISCELFLEEIQRIDGAVGGRIKQRCGKYIMQVTRDTTRNYRDRRR